MSQMHCDGCVFGVITAMEETTSIDVHSFVYIIIRHPLVPAGIGYDVVALFATCS